MTLKCFEEYLLTRVLPQLNETGQRRVEKLRNIDHNSIKIFENYGCAIIYSDPFYGVSRVPQIAITMIALDPWKFSCSQRKDLNYVMTALCEESSYLSVGTINADLLEDHLATFQKELKKATAKHGHQRTPGFIYSILQQGFVPSGPLGLRSCPGFTDVGQHSGQVPPRDTKWSLMQAITKHHLRMTDIAPLVRCPLCSISRPLVTIFEYPRSFV
jgi:hypothetical protein